ncbi:MAG: 2-phosphosulfolactate phosphatase family protein [Prochlorococcus sp.]|jgi:2-phosphosulfolactate phosphatase|nr:2-phosphosulfolactate phosphatase family protein [Prochlorococcaceae cyanobacterium ETNP14_MAG_4]
MQLAYFHVAADVPEGDRPDAAVVIDVLRATTTIAWALHNGAEAVQAFADLDILKQVAAQWPKPSRLLLGERGGKRIDGFDLGNSPVAVLPELVAGKRLFMSTTNGTRSLQRVREVGRLYTLALPNRRAVAEKLLRDQPAQLWIVGSGWEGTYSLEDSLAAGALASLLLDAEPDIACVVNDELTAALALWKQWKHDPEACLRQASHGQRLIGLGDHDADFSCCAGLDQLSVVPIQVEPGVFCAY